MDRKDAKRFHEWVGARFEGVDKWEAQDLTIKGSRCTFDPTSGEVKVALTFIVGDAKAGQVAEFGLYGKAYGLAPDDFGRTFQFNGRGRTYRISGINPRARKRPILATNEADGRTYVFESVAVCRQLRPWNVTEHGGTYYYGDPKEDAEKEKAWRTGTVEGRWAEGRKAAAK